MRKHKFENDLILYSQIIHVNGATAHIPKDKVYNKGNVCYELLITESTSITAKGIFEIKRKDLKITDIKLEDCSTKVGSVISTEQQSTE